MGEIEKTKSTEWLTPRWMVEAFQQYGGFDLDPCAAQPPRPIETARKCISLPVEGLCAPWTGTVWLNPPRSRNAHNWLGKLSTHRAGGVALVAVSTDSEWWSTMVHSRASSVLFLASRLKFMDQDGRTGGSCNAPSCLVSYGENFKGLIRQMVLNGDLLGNLWLPTDQPPDIYRDMPYESAVALS
jgi:hypothetical protein